MKVGTVLKEIRKKKGLTQGEVSKKIKYAQSYLSKVEHGESEPSGDFMKKIAKLYKVPVEYIILKSLEPKDVDKNKRELFNELRKPLLSLLEEVLEEQK